MEEKSNYIINEIVYFSPEDNILRPVENPKSEVRLNVPASRCLQLLLQNAGGVVTKQDFFAEVWEKQGQYVASNTFYQNISILRKALKATGIDDDVVKTVPKKGIRFSGNVKKLKSEDISILENSINISHATKVDKLVSIIDQNEHLPVTNTKTVKSLIFFIALLLLTPIGIVIVNNTKKNSMFFDNYQMMSLGACQIHYRATMNYKQVVMLMNSHHISCDNNNHIFVTVNKQESRTSFTVCSKYSRAEQNCQSFLYVRDSK